MHQTDFVIIGGGVIGSAIAYHLARERHRVLVIERMADVAGAPSASWASAGGVRAQARERAEVALAVAALARWPALAAELDADVGYEPTGNLLVAEHEANVERLRAFVATQRRHGLADVHLVGRDDVRALVPNIAAHVVAGSYHPLGGQADPRLTTRAFAAAARRHGATYWTQTTCHALQVDRARLTLVRTSRGDVRAPVTVLGVGAWSRDLAAGIGLPLPMQMFALQMLQSSPTPAPARIPVISAIDRALSLKRLPNGAYLLGGGWLGDLAADGQGCSVRQDSIDGNWNAACAILPTLAAHRIEQSWCGVEAISADRLPFIGPVPGIAGLYLATGFSGHGFAIAPAVGRAVAAELTGAHAPELDGLRPDRAGPLRAPAMGGRTSR